MNTDPFAGHDRFALLQRITAMVNRYEIRPLDAAGNPGELLALAQQKRLALREQVTFYADEARSQPLFGFKARQRLDLGARYDVTAGPAGGGSPIGAFRKDFAASLLRSTWHLEQPDGLVARGHERNRTVAVLRRAWEFVPVLGDVPFFWPLHFDFARPDGTPVASVTRARSLRDRYLVTVSDPALDRRLALAMAVALDALQGR